MNEPGREHGGGYRWLPALIIAMAALMIWLYFGRGA
jgi:hypothetical protein